MKYVTGMVIVAVIALLLGSALQMIMWFKDDRSIWQALIYKPNLWIAYLIGSGLLMERVFRFIYTRMEKRSRN